MTIPFKTIIAIGLLMSATASVCMAQHLKCSTEGSVPIDLRKEAARIRLVRDTVSRRSIHDLVIKIAAKEIHFLDEPPFTGWDIGTIYEYCDHQDGYYLLQKFGKSVIGGVVLNDKTGAMLPGGDEVIFSKDRRVYLAIAQQVHAEETTWKIYALKDGRLSWSGSGVFLKNSTAYLDNPAWTETGELVATATCDETPVKKWPVKLRKIKGEWDLGPIYFCKNDSPDFKHPDLPANKTSTNR